MSEIKLDPSFSQLPLAHRGLHNSAEGRVENSRSACAAAVAAGYGIEIDIQRSSDNRAMVFHDYSLGRLTGENGHLSKRTSAELGQIELTGGGETIPTLKEILDLVSGAVPLLIEIKDQDGQMGPDTGPLERAVAEELQDYQGPAAVMSFNPNSVAAFKFHLPGAPIGLTTAAFDGAGWGFLPEARREELATLKDVERLGASFISHDRRALADAPVNALRKKGLPIFCWTIRSAEEEVEARQFADNITFEGYLPAH